MTRSGDKSITLTDRDGCSLDYILLGGDQDGIATARVTGVGGTLYLQSWYLSQFSDGQPSGGEGDDECRSSLDNKYYVSDPESGIYLEEDEVRALATAMPSLIRQLSQSTSASTGSDPDQERQRDPSGAEHRARSAPSQVFDSRVPGRDPYRRYLAMREAEDDPRLQARRRAHPRARYGVHLPPGAWQKMFWRLSNLMRIGPDGRWTSRDLGRQRWEGAADDCLERRDRVMLVVQLASKE